MDTLTFDGYNRGYKVKNSWICSNSDTLNEYNKDTLCGYTFTINGFINLYKLMTFAFSKKGWLVNNPLLDIYIIAGTENPVIQNKGKIKDLKLFLENTGYKITVVRRQTARIAE